MPPQSDQEIPAASCFTLANRAGTEVDLCAYGARIVEVRTRGCGRMPQNISLSFPDRAAYDASGSFAGATVGPAAGRIAGGRLTLPGGLFQLTRNDGPNTLHGGRHDLAHTLWQTAGADVCSAAFCCSLPDGLDGFPGNRKIAARYTLDETDTLTIRYTAVTDKATFLNLTNHTYWNLSGDFSAPAYGHLLEIAADRVFYNDSAHLPAGCHAVARTAFDFTSPRLVADAMRRDPENPQLANARGYNNAYLLRENAAFAARLSDPAAGRRVTLATDYPCLVFYTGGYLPVPGCALALEAQYAPNTCEPVLLPGKVFRRRISFRFETI